MASVFDYVFNLSGNFTQNITGMTDATGRFSGALTGTTEKIQKVVAVLGSFDYFRSIVQNMADGLNQVTAAGVKLDSQMHDLSAVAGVTGDGLKQIETFARESAKTFGTDASVAVEGYKLLLSQLSPELGKYPEALRSMGDCIQTTSKLMGGDGVAAAQVLTTAMNQYGVSLEDPTAASEEMARMMNVMAAAGQAGSAELPAISAALQQCGMAAKAANVSFEETNAAKQDTRTSGKKASEGGVALRNVLGQLSKGRFVEKQAREELEKAIEIRDVFTNITNQYSYNDLSKRTENTLYTICKNFYETCNYINRIVESTSHHHTQNITNSNTSFLSFSNYAIPTVKPVKQESNFASYVTENLSYSTVNYNEELNSLAMPSYSTTLIFNNPRGILMADPFPQIGKRVSEPIKDVNGLWERNDYSVPKKAMREMKRDFIQDTLKGRGIPESEEWHIRNKQQEEPLRRKEIAGLVETAIIDLLR